MVVVHVIRDPRPFLSLSLPPVSLGPPLLGGRAFGDDWLYRLYFYDLLFIERYTL